MIVAVINNGVVAQIVTIPDGDQTGMYNQLAQSCQAAIDITNMSPQPSVGWTFDGANLNSNGSTSTWKITKLAFNSRFQVSELMAILAAAAGTSPQALELQIVIKRQGLATYIDLSRSDTQAGVEILVSFGLITQARATQILTTPPTSQEIYQG